MLNPLNSSNAHGPRRSCRPTGLKVHFAARGSVFTTSGWVKLWQGKPEAAIEDFKRAIRMSPKDAQLFDMQDAMASAYFVIGKYREALAAAKAAVRERPFTLAYCVGAASAAHIEELGEAQRLVSTLRRLEPDLRIAGLKHLFTELKRPGDFDRLADGLRRAGLPE